MRRNSLGRGTALLGLAGLLLAACSTTLHHSASTTAIVLQVSQDQFSDHAEPSMATNPTDPNNLLAASMVLQGPTRGLATYASFDGGRTWRSNGLLPGSGLRYDADVTVTFDSSGHGFVCGWVGDRAQEARGAVRVWRTDDGGRTFQKPVMAVSGFLDHPGLAADPTFGSKDLYLAGSFTSGDGLRFARSTDDGQSFGTSRPIDPTTGKDGRLPVIAAGPNGLVAVMYYVYQPDGTATAEIVTSTDHGATFGPPKTLGSVQRPSSVGAISARSGPAVAIDPHSGEIYAAIATGRNDGRSRISVYFSADLGRSWSTARMSAALSSGQIYAQPQLAVDKTGQVGLLAFDITTNHVQPMLFLLHPGDTKFDNPQSLQPGGFHPATTAAQANRQDAADSVRQAWIGDYQALVSTPTGFRALWNAGIGARLQLVTAPTPRTESAPVPRVAPHSTGDSRRALRLDQH
jgi:hypothetical protein